MRAINRNNVLGKMVIACLVATQTMAQQNKIADDDLLRMLESADSQPAAATAPAQKVAADAVNNEEEAIPVAPEVEQMADDDLLKMLKSADSQPAAASASTREVVADVVNNEAISVAPEVEPVAAEVPASDPLARVLDSVKAADARAEEADSSMAEPVAEEVAATIDDVDMEAFGEDSASTSGQLISVRLNKVGLEEAISLFAQLSGANIIVPELGEVSQISVNLKDVEWRSALQSILDSYNYELFQKVPGSNVYSVRRRPPGAPEPQVVETFKLRYATVPNVAALIRELLPVDAKISEFASRNMIVVKSSESGLSEIRSVLASIDIVRQQVFIESKFMELADGAQQDLGIDWQALQAYSAGTVGSTDRGYSKTDTTRTERNSFTDSLGRSYAEGSGFTDGDTLDGNFPVFEGLTPLSKTSSSAGSTEFLTSVLSADEFRLVLSALQENKGVNVVSNPKIIVANEEKANISIVRKEPNLKQERQQAMNDTPDTVTFTLDEKEPFFKYGVELDVTPSINTSSNITVRIKPSLTRKFGDKQAGDNTYPIIDEKTIETVFSLASGQTAAIGGLTELDDSEIERKVPVLGSIPYLGRLFSWKQTVSDQRETIIFVTVGLADTMAINAETGLPEDSELARRQIIKDRSKKTIRSQGREFFEAEEGDKVEDMLKVMRQKEDERQQNRLRALQQEQEKAAKQQAKETTKLASIS